MRVEKDRQHRINVGCTLHFEWRMRPRCMTGRITQRLLEIASVLALLVAGFVTVRALYGSSAIQFVEPMTNPFSSHERDWGTHARLLEIPAVMVILYAFGLLLAKY